MRKLVYRIWNNSTLVNTVTTLKEKHNAEKNGYSVTEDFEEVKSFQPWEKKEEHKPFKQFTQYKEKFAR